MRAYTQKQKFLTVNTLRDKKINVPEQQARGTLPTFIFTCQFRVLLFNSDIRVLNEHGSFRCNCSVPFGYHAIACRQRQLACGRQKPTPSRHDQVKFS